MTSRISYEDAEWGEEAGVLREIRPEWGIKGKDSFGSWLGIMYEDEVDISAKLVGRGYAEQYEQGETFNETGKTDILLRHEGSNVFIAELKFWRGKKVYLDTIRHLLGYLTWRGSKSAIAVFVKNKNFSSVLDAIKGATLEHENCLGFVSEQEEGWYHYRFHISDDKNREVRMSGMLFHIPE